jgi:hypothetical protein
MSILLPPVFADPEDKARVVAKIDAVAEALGRAWRRSEDYRYREGKRVVLADLTVDSWNGIFTRLIIAKYMAWIYDARLCAVVHTTKAVPYLTRRIATAFGCREYLGMAEALAVAQNDVPDINAAVLDLVRDWPREGQGLRDAVAALRINGMPVGDLVYDTYLRGSGRPTIERMDNGLLSCVGDAVFRDRLNERLFSQYDIAAVNSAHVVYNYFGMLTRGALARNIDVTQDLSINPVRLKRFNRFEHARLPLAHFAPREFDAVWRHEREQAVAFGEDYIRRRVGGRAEMAYKDGEDGPYGAARRLYDKQALCARLGWDPEKPVVAVLSHVYFESPHATYSELFNDVYEWLETTLAVAAANPHIQWLFKPHPDQKHYDDNVAHSPDLVRGDEVARRLMAPYAGVPHVAQCPDDLNTGSLAGSVNAVVTMYGNAGHEFAAQGTPVVLAARAPYARLGFAMEPRTRAEYAQTLAGLHQVQPLTREQRERAMTYIYMFFEKSRALTDLMAPVGVQGFWAPQYDPAVLDGVLERADRFEPDQDPLYEAVRTMIENNAFCLNMPAC